MFKLEIELGNAAMQTTEDVARALENVAQRIREDGCWGSDDDNGTVKWHIESGSIRDLNGNTVGNWEVGE